ncbi:MAG: hypothetical protein ACXADH_10730 [Candidatus Kariarchaeaceae archaeon]|jgi:hypothetical protein
MSTLKHVIDDLFEAKYAIPREKSFWDFVEHADWTSDHDYRRIEGILKTFDIQMVKTLNGEYEKAINKLNSLLDDKVRGVSDDGYSDLLSHIVGSGKKVYDAVLKDWGEAQDIIDRREYEEGFQYIWHDYYDQVYLREAKYDEHDDDKKIDDVVTTIAEILTDYVTQRGLYDEGAEQIKETLIQAAKDGISFQGLSRAITNRIRGDADWSESDVDTINEITQELWNRILVNIEDVEDSLSDEDW